MIKIRVITKEDIDGGYRGTELRNLKPRRYMCGLSFEQLLQYIKEELYWEDIKEDDVMEIEIFNKKEQWTDYVAREGR